MFLINNKLKKRKSFNYIFSNGKRVNGNFVNLVYVQTNSKIYKVGFSVNKKVGNAVVRNKSKRLIKEAFRNISKPIKNNYNYIFVARPEIADATFLQICNDVENLIKKGKFYEDVCL